MTKAERRELQERQRAEKAARDEKGAAPSAKAAGKQPPGASAPKKSGKEAAPTKGGAQAGTSKVLRDLKEGAATNDDLARRTHGLRIFSHFGLTKAVSGKGDVHPSITRLALLFSSFKICGANARCLATLAAFKAVSLLYDLPTPSLLKSNPGYTRLCNSAQQYSFPPSHDLSLAANITPRYGATYVCDYGQRDP
jgi:translation initiation factor eIF-2B subunit delta